MNERHVVTHISLQISQYGKIGKGLIHDEDDRRIFDVLVCGHILHRIRVLVGILQFFHCTGRVTLRRLDKVVADTEDKIQNKAVLIGSLLFPCLGLCVRCLLKYIAEKRNHKGRADDSLQPVPGVFHLDFPDKHHIQDAQHNDIRASVMQNERIVLDDAQPGSNRDQIRIYDFISTNRVYEIVRVRKSRQRTVCRNRGPGRPAENQLKQEINRQNQQNIHQMRMF